MKREVQPRQPQQNMQSHNLLQAPQHQAHLQMQRDRKVAAARRAKEAVQAVEEAMRAAVFAVEEVAAEEAAEVTAGDSLPVSCAETLRQLEGMEEAQAQRPPMPCVGCNLDRRLNTRGGDMPPTGPGAPAQGLHAHAQAHAQAVVASAAATAMQPAGLPPLPPQQLPPLQATTVPAIGQLNLR